MNKQLYLRDLMKLRFEEAKAKNHLYSLRSHARDLNISAATYSDFAAGKRELSEGLLERLFESLKPSEIDKEVFHKLPSKRDFMIEKSLAFILNRNLPDEMHLKIKIKTTSQTTMSDFTSALEKLIAQFTIAES